jgi:hypothetical protein
MATKKAKSDRREAEDSDHVIITATHEIRVDDFGNLLSCVDSESGEESDVPLEYRYLTN